MRAARIVSLEVKQKAARFRKAKFEATQRTTRTGAIATLIVFSVVALYIIAQYI